MPHGVGDVGPVDAGLRRVGHRHGGGPAQPVAQAGPATDADAVRVRGDGMGAGRGRRVSCRRDASEDPPSSRRPGPGRPVCSRGVGGPSPVSAVQVVWASGPGVCGVPRACPGGRHAGPATGDPVSVRRVVVPPYRCRRGMRLRLDGVPAMAVGLARAAV
ncbi:hypothetical protein [Bifidobacterium adolescentis]|uniref:hypothetical protein n=2 Tax=Bifidobacterium TaxID=1678 RepID=UPI0022E110F7|nr:hypothetical protein [Bifidobacterium adolescentis]